MATRVRTNLWANLPGVIMAYQGMGAPSFTHTLVNMAHNGDPLYKLYTTASPTWNYATGWTFNGTSQFLNTGYAPLYLSGGNTPITIIARFSSVTGTGYLCGTSSNVTPWPEIGLRPNNVTNRRYVNGGSLSPSGAKTSGVMGMNGNKGWFDGVQDTGSIATATGSITANFTIGALMQATGTPYQWLNGKIQAIAFYDRILTDNEMISVSRQLRYLDSDPDWSVWSTGWAKYYKIPFPFYIDQSIDITPAAAAPSATATSPTVIAGSLALTPAAGPAKATATSPTVLVGGINVTPAAAAPSATATSPVVVLGSITVTPAAGPARATATSPTVLGGGINVTPAAAAPSATATSPTVIAGSLALTPAAAAPSATATSPVVALGSMVVVPVAAAPSAAATSPAVIQSSLTLTPAAGPARARATSPTAIAGSLVLTPAAGPARARATSPSLVLGSMVVVPVAGQASAMAVAPMVIYGGIEGRGRVTPGDRAAAGLAGSDRLIGAVELSDYV